ncbi:MAG TPA: hypothetical protein VFU43_03515 [Streptosporangiaceae bacterium]|nr:hypothetical protein [Streptosporangiaceae bacterium]
MAEKDDALGALDAAGVLGGMRWAWETTRRQTLQAYDPETGHDQGWVGYNTFKVLTDRLDRVFSCNRFALRPGDDPASGEDFLAAGLGPQEFESMPRLPADLVVYDDLNQSPGWRHSEWRILLQSYSGHHIDHIPWRQKSKTKQRIAMQPNPDQLMISAPELMAFDALFDAEEPRQEGGEPVVTLVGAYALDAATAESTFYLGRPRLVKGRREAAWFWRELLLRHDGDGPDLVRLAPLSPPSPAGPTRGLVEDAPVHIKRTPQARPPETER